ncbi:hypothetical protein SprV_0100368600 [Sparganum proliferum]
MHPQSQLPTPPNMPKLSTNILRADRPRQTCSNLIRRGEKPNHYLSYNPTPTPTASTTTTTLTHRRQLNSPSTSASTADTITMTIEPEIFVKPSCLRRHRTFTSSIGLVGKLRIHRTGKCIRRHHVNCQHCPRTFTHRTGPLDHMCIHENLR